MEKKNDSERERQIKEMMAKFLEELKSVKIISKDSKYPKFLPPAKEPYYSSWDYW